LNFANSLADLDGKNILLKVTSFDLKKIIDMQESDMNMIFISKRRGDKEKNVDNFYDFIIYLKQIDFIIGKVM
jgi:flavodoxin